VALSKADLVDDEAMGVARQKLRRPGMEFLAISSVSGAGLQQLLERCWRLLEGDRDGR
jgi:ethanolamine utilization protein EutP (predicted NTPase)